MSVSPPPQLNNPDMRVVIIKDFVKSNFPATPLLDYALEVEKITTSKVRVCVCVEGGMGEGWVGVCAKWNKDWKGTVEIKLDKLFL